MMKYTALLLFTALLILASCGKKEEAKLEVFNPEAFAYDLGGSGWEVNASTRVKGFVQTEKNNMYTASLAYDVDLVTPKGDTVKALISKVADKQDKEKMMDVGLEAQFDLDSTYNKGNYKIIFNVQDVQTNQKAKTSADFKLD